MTAISALRTGAGLVSLGIPESLNPIVEAQALEVMTSPLPQTQDGVLSQAAFNVIKDLLVDKKCLAIGPGLGTLPETRKLFQQIILASKLPVVIDADGLNCLADDTSILESLEVPLILTPHPGEMARLIDGPTRFVQQDRITCAREFAKRFRAHVVLKGARTVIAHPDGRVFINPTGNPGMASGGMGDVLTGMIAGLLAQGYPPEIAAHAGVYLHGAAADTLAECSGPFGFLATDVMQAVPAEIEKLAQFISRRHQSGLHPSVMPSG
jgi:NAD(P)H-hydrate epimerase